MAIIYHSLHIPQPSITCLVHITHMSSVWTSFITLDFQPLVRRHRALPSPFSFILDIGQPTPILTFLHRLCPVKNIQPISNVAHPNRIFPKHNGKSTSKVACLHRLFHAYNGQSTSNVGDNYYLWSSHIDQSTSNVVFYYHLQPYHICFSYTGYGLPTSSLACTHCSADVKYVLATSLADSIMCTPNI